MLTKAIIVERGCFFFFQKVTFMSRKNGIGVFNAFKIILKNKRKIKSINK